MLRIVGWLTVATAVPALLDTFLVLVRRQVVLEGLAPFVQVLLLLVMVLVPVGKCIAGVGLARMLSWGRVAVIAVWSVDCLIRVAGAINFAVASYWWRNVPPPPPPQGVEVVTFVVKLWPGYVVGLIGLVIIWVLMRPAVRVSHAAVQAGRREVIAQQLAPGTRARARVPDLYVRLKEMTRGRRSLLAVGVVFLIVSLLVAAWFAFLPYPFSLSLAAREATQYNPDWSVSAADYAAAKAVAERHLDFYEILYRVDVISQDKIEFWTLFRYTGIVAAGGSVLVIEKVDGVWEQANLGGGWAS